VDGGNEKPVTAVGDETAKLVGAVGFEAAEGIALSANLRNGGGGTMPLNAAAAAAMAGGSGIIMASVRRPPKPGALAIATGPSAADIYFK
jgi:predicted secreted protein